MFRLGLLPLQCRADGRRARAVEELVEAGVALRADGHTELHRLDGEGEVNGLVLADEGLLQGGHGVPTTDRGLAMDVSPWLRPDANTCADRAFCHTFGRGEGKHQMVPGWPYSVVAALETGRTSWTAVLDAVRLELGADVAAVTTVQIREVIERLVAAGQWRPDDPEVLVVLDAGYDAPRIAHLLGDLPVEILGRLRSDRVMRRPTPSREEFHVAIPKGGRPPKHGGEFVFGESATWGNEQAVTVTGTRLYGKATAQAWDRLHPRLTRRAAWLDHDGPLPVIEGTVIRLVVQKLPSGGVNKPVWLW
ncbi:hypothetical protein GCM10010236_79360 [Streptomyces eurythermus]|nr:hypothetical protein GCM10010236_79360 [Streptomyces eurythermus]